MILLASYNQNSMCNGNIYGCFSLEIAMGKEDNSYSHILKCTSLFGGVQMLGILMGLVRNKFVAVLLGPSGMGLVALFSSTIKFVTDSTNFGLHISAVRDISMAYDNGDEATLEHKIHVFRHWMYAAAVLGLIVCIALSPLLSQWTFSFGNHTLHFVLLSPVVALTTVSVGEAAILKATRKLRALAMSSVYGAVGVMIVSVPIYWIYGNAGIIPSLVLMALAQALAVMVFSLRIYPLRMSFDVGSLREGMAFLRLGIAFVVSGMLGSGAELAIRAYLSNVSDVDTVGLYNAMYVMIFTYAGMVFTALDTDYYPRLSAIKHPGCELNAMVNSQMEVSMHMVSPLIILFMLLMPVLLPLLYSGEFKAVLPMLQAASLSMYGRCVYLPMEYISLSRGDTKMFLCTEMFSAIVLVAFVIFGYGAFGLIGVGIGIAMAYLVEMTVVAVACFVRYGYRMSCMAFKTIAVHIAFGACAYLCTCSEDMVIYCIAGGAFFVVDACMSLYAIVKHTTIVDTLKNKMR